MMRRLFFFLFFIHSSVFAGQLFICPNLNSPMNQRLAWAFHNNNQKLFWIGYSITRLMDPDQIFISNVSFRGTLSFDSGQIPLKDWITGVNSDRQQTLSAAAQSELDRLDHKKREKVRKELAVFERFRDGSSVPDSICVVDMSVHYGFREPLFWIGNVSHEESFQYLTNQYERLPDERKRQLIGAVSIHPSGMAFPFLKEVLTGKSIEMVQQSAAIFTGELDTPDALALLQNVASTNPSEDVRQSAIAGIGDMDLAEATQVLSEMALSHPDRDLRRTAMAMLSDKNDAQALGTLEKIAWFDPDREMRESAIAMMSESENAVPLLLKLANDHPSRKTREAAIRMLAETVAGREVLKKKLNP